MFTVSLASQLIPNNFTCSANGILATQQTKDYNLFGVPLEGRTWNADKYRYTGVNGQEADLELGSGVSSAEYWEYDSKLGRRWNIDPKPNAHMSYYSCFGNSPIWKSDIKGDTIKYAPGIPADHQFFKNLNDLRKNNKQFDKILKRLESSKTVYNVTTDKLPEGTGGVFNPSNNSITISDEILGGKDKGAIQGAIAEEFFHAFQKDFYGKEKYDKYSENIAVESEAKLFIASLANDAGFSKSDIEGAKKIDNPSGDAVKIYYSELLYSNRNIVRSYISVISGNSLGSATSQAIVKKFVKFYKDFHFNVYVDYRLDYPKKKAEGTKYELETSAVENAFSH